MEERIKSLNQVIEAEIRYYQQQTPDTDSPKAVEHALIETTLVGIASDLKGARRQMQVLKRRFY